MSSFVNGSKIMLEYVNCYVKNHQRLFLLLSYLSKTKPKLWHYFTTVLDSLHEQLTKLDTVFTVIIPPTRIIAHDAKC